MTLRGGTLLVSIGFLLLGCSAPPASHQHGAAGPRASTARPLFEDLGRYHRAITTTSPQAQAYFDQGLRLVYGFNHYEVQAVFREAARLDPACAMCAWGLALTYGSNYNSPTDAEREQGAGAAVTRAQTLATAGDSERLQDQHWFTEPPPWYYPARQSLGVALLQAGRAAEAEAVYREDLRRNPENGWSRFGLGQSLRAQRKTADAAAVDARVRLAWARADVTLTASRL